MLWLAHHRVLVGVTFVAVLVADVASKQWILSLLGWGEFIDVVPRVRLVLVLNTGVSFGMAADWAVPPWVLGGFACVVGVGLLLWATQHAQLWQAVGLALIAGGAWGNGLDRFFYGAVVDFLDVELWNGYHWPAFNVADSAITCGAVLYLVRELWFGERAQSKL
ncbi:MAG: signal peptidase II [Alphaproteobacteria bacterium GM202ARS2]|nr:signal peptidase II [Alphaproteobacteria bacterium GM202ARS2]